MKKAVAIVGAAAAAALLVFLGVAFFFAQRADYGWNPAAESPEFTARHPRVLFDEGHYNASSIGIAGRYWPLGRLLRADGYAVTRGEGHMTPRRLRGVDVLVIANASGAPKPQLFGVNIPVRTDRKRGDPAFTSDEIRTISSWVRKGGSLLLIADHAPFGEAAAALCLALGVTMHKGFVEVPGEMSDPLVFSAENGRLGRHPIIEGGRAARVVRRVMTYTGQSLDGPPGAAVLLRLPENAVEFVPEGDTLATRAAGPAQGLAFTLGAGRVVVLGEAGMATAQVSRRSRYGMNDPGNDNRRFVINVMRWLSRKL